MERWSGGIRYRRRLLGCVAFFSLVLFLFPLTLFLTALQPVQGSPDLHTGRSHPSRAFLPLYSPLQAEF
jgi:hypothetical protein